MKCHSRAREHCQAEPQHTYYMHAPAHNMSLVGTCTFQGKAFVHVHTIRLQFISTVPTHGHIIFCPRELPWPE